MLPVRRQNDVALLPGKTVCNLVDGMGCISGKDDFIWTGRVEELTQLVSSIGHGFRNGCSVPMDRTTAAPRCFGVVAMNGVDDGLRLERDAGVVKVGRRVVAPQGWKIFSVLAEHLTTLPGLA